MRSAQAQPMRTMLQLEKTKLPIKAGPQHLHFMYWLEQVRA